MTTLGIFTVKILCRHEGCYYTYGGFGDYLAFMRASFNHVLLVAHVKDMVPPCGYYLIPPNEDLEVIHLPYVRSELGVLLTLPVMLWRSWYAATRIHIAHARMPDYTGIVGVLVCRLRGVPVFCQIIADWYIEAKRMPITRKYGLGLPMKLHLYLYDLLERLVCRGLVVFAQGRTCYDKHNKHSDCELVLSTAHRFEDIVEPLSRFRRPPYTILTVARLTGVKNQELILQALAQLRRKGEDWRLVLVGEGPRREPLEAMVRELNLHDHVTFAGQVQHGERLWRYYDEADCFVLSSRSEGTPKVLLEAMARGLPIVASNVAGVPSSVKHGERGLLFEDNDVEGLVASLHKILVDQRLRESIVAKAHHFCADHTVERATTRMLEKVFANWPHLRCIKRDRA